MVDLHWIRDDLAVGARFPMELAAWLACEQRIRAVVDLRIESCDDATVLGSCGIALLHLPTVDADGIALEMIDRGVAWVRQYLERGDRVLIHCEHGVGRSSLLAACVLVDLGATPLRAVDSLKRTRPVVSWSLLQQQRFREWCARHLGGAAPALEEIRRAVWREGGEP